MICSRMAVRAGLLLLMVEVVEAVDVVCAPLFSDDLSVSFHGLSETSIAEESSKVNLLIVLMCSFSLAVSPMMFTNPKRPEVFLLLANLCV